MARVPSEQRREELVRAAVQVIGREGVDGATTRKIAEQAGAPLATLHYIFKDKDELFAAAIANTQSRAISSYRERLAPGCGLETATKTLIELHHAWTLEDPGFMIAQYELLFWAARTPSVKRYAPLTYQGYFDAFTKILTGCATEDESAEDVARLARYALAIIDGMILQMIALGKRGPAAAEAADYARGAMSAALDQLASPLP